MIWFFFIEIIFISFIIVVSCLCVICTNYDVYFYFMYIFLKLYLFDRSLRPFGSSVGALLLTTGLVCYIWLFFNIKKLW